MPLLHPAPTTRHCEAEGLVILLDLRNGRYTTLNRAASAMWRGLLESDDRAALEAALAARLGAPAERVAADLEAFARSSVADGLLCERPPQTPPPPVRPRAGRPRAAAAWTALLATTRSLARHGFAPTYTRYARLPRPPRDESWQRRLEAAERAFARAELAFVIRSAPKDCLPRSLALWRFLVASGVPAEHHIGVTRYPFGAHAWVEAGGEVLFDSRERVADYASIAVL